MMLDILLAANIHDVLLISPLMIGVAIAEFLVTMGAATFRVSGKVYFVSKHNF